MGEVFDYVITMIDDENTMILAMNPVIRREPAGIFSKWFSATQSEAPETHKSSHVYMQESVASSTSATSPQTKRHHSVQNMSASPAKRKTTNRKQNEDPGQPGKGLMNMAEAQANLYNWEKAFDLWDQALQVQKEKLGQHHMTVASTRARRGRAFSQLGQWYPAALDLGKAAHIFQGKDDALASDTFMKLAIAQDRMGHFDEAIANMQKALELKEKIQDQEGIARLHCLIGRLHHRRRDYTSAMESYRVGLECYERAGVAKDHPDVMWASRRASDRNMIGHIFWRNAGQGS
jgi:tetratricopeptide (TPR) repeat protein